MRLYFGLLAIAALLLGFAGIGKIVTHQTIPCARDPFFGSHDLVGVFGCIELFLASWIVFFCNRLSTLLLLAPLFLIFSVVNVSSVLGGSSDCGCFAFFHPSTLAMALLDFGIAVSLIAFRPS